jgi:type IV secretory pathway VirB10-like protein
VLVIALSGHNAPKVKASSALAPIQPVDPNAAQIEAYESQLKGETQRLQAAKEQLARTQQAIGLPPLASTGYAADSRASGLTRSVPAVELHDERLPAMDAVKREEASLFASNVALSYRSEPPQTQSLSAPATLSPTDAVAKALSAYAPAQASPATPTGPVVPTAASQAPPGRAAEASADSERERDAVRDGEIDRAVGQQYRLFEGTVIETVLTNRLDGSFSGPVNCMVTASVYSHNGQHVLIPQGSRVLGEARKVETFGDTRLAVVFHRLIMPDGYSLSLDKFHGLNQIGETGLDDLVNHHYLQVFGVSLAIGAIAGFSQANTNYGTNESSLDAYRQGAAASLSQSSLHVLDRYLNVLPTITIREGHRVRVYLSDDLLLPAYEKHQMPNDL